MEPDISSRIAEAVSSRGPLPAIDNALSLDEAYRLQHQVTSICSPGKVGGIKAGVTADPVQKYFGLDHALIGSLYENSQLASGCVLPYLADRKIECELCVVVDKDGQPKSVAPAIEIVHLKFSNPADMSVSSLIACNLGADVFIVGEFLPWEPVFNAPSMRLTRNGEVVNQADMSEALGGAKAAAAWMWQEAMKRGHSCVDGTLFLTGSCGTIISADTGFYSAVYDQLGKVEFSIE